MEAWLEGLEANVILFIDHDREAFVPVDHEAAPSVFGGVFAADEVFLDEELLIEGGKGVHSDGNFRGAHGSEVGDGGLDLFEKFEAIGFFEPAREGKILNVTSKANPAGDDDPRIGFRSRGGISVFRFHCVQITCARWAWQRDARIGGVDVGNNPRDDGGMAATRTTEYAVRALVVLALEGRSGQVKHAAALAQISGTPAKFMEQVLRLLRKGGFIVSRRGAGGGYELARAAEKIRMGEIVGWVDGQGGSPSEKRGDAVGEVWGNLQKDAEQAAWKVLQAESLARLAERVQAKLAAKGKLNEYQI